ncbi:hypothetical protein TNCV_1726701 [Trichonephila clavipes]|nr:hypothetical protein TNCV_1726701 [Trichonephila clavipes]
MFQKNFLPQKLNKYLSCTSRLFDPKFKIVEETLFAQKVQEKQREDHRHPATALKSSLTSSEYPTSCLLWDMPQQRRYRVVSMETKIMALTFVKRSFSFCVFVSAILIEKETIKVFSQKRSL